MWSLIVVTKKGKKRKRKMSEKEMRKEEKMRRDIRDKQLSERLPKKYPVESIRI